MRLTWLYSGLLLVCMPVWGLRAQQVVKDTPPDSSRLQQVRILPDLLVSAHKKYEAHVHVGKNLFAIGADQLAHSEGLDLPQLLQQAGLTVNGASSNFSTLRRPFVRGAAAKYGLVLFDGVPLLDPSGVGGGYDLRLLTISSLQAVEVMRGSYSTLYGSGAVAGVINFLSKKPSTEKALQIEAQSAAGNPGYWQNTLGLSGTLLTLTPGSIGLSYRMNLSQRQSTGLSEAATPIGYSGVPFDEDNFYRHGINTHVLLDMQKITLKPYFHHAIMRYAYDASGFTDGPQAHTGSMYMGGIDASWRYTSTAQLKLKLSVQNAVRDYKSLDLAGESVVLKYNGSLRFAELYTHFQPHARVDLLAGLEYRHQQMVPLQATPSAAPFTETISPYVIVNTQPIVAVPLRLEVGVRANNHTRYGTYVTYDVNPFYLLTERTKIYVNYATSFLAPSLFELYSPDSGNPALQPEQAQSLELGTIRSPRVSLAQNRTQLAWRVATFYRRLQEIITWQFPGGYINRDGQNYYGLEVEPTYYIGKNWEIAFAYALVAGEEVKKNEQGNTTTQTYDLLRIPKHNYRFNLQWKPVDKLCVRANLHALSERVDNDYSRFPAEQVTLVPYTLLSFYASYDLLFKAGTWRVFADVKNILDQRDYVEVYGYNTFGRRFMLGISLTY